MLEELRVHVKLVEFVVEVRATVPVNPLVGAIVMVDVAVAPALAVTLVGLAVMVKFGGSAVTWNTTLTTTVAVPLVPVTFA